MKTYTSFPQECCIFWIGSILPGLPGQFFFHDFFHYAFGVSTNFIPWAPRITARGSRSARSMGFREAEVTFPPTYKYIPGGSWMAIPSGGGTCVVRCFTGAPNWSLCFFWGGLYSYFIYVYIYIIYIWYIYYIIWYIFMRLRGCFFSKTTGPKVRQIYPATFITSGGDLSIQRTPAWCDRVLFCHELSASDVAERVSGNNQVEVEVVEYDSYPLRYTSCSVGTCGELMHPFFGGLHDVQCSQKVSKSNICKDSFSHFISLLKSSINSCMVSEGFSKWNLPTHFSTKFIMYSHHPVFFTWITHQKL